MQVLPKGSQCLFYSLSFQKTNFIDPYTHQKRLNEALVVDKTAIRSRPSLSLVTREVDVDVQSEITDK